MVRSRVPSIFLILVPFVSARWYLVATYRGSDETPRLFRVWQSSEFCFGGGFGSTSGGNRVPTAVNSSRKETLYLEGKNIH
jgi:hypothetical protein